MWQSLKRLFKVAQPGVKEGDIGKNAALEPKTNIFDAILRHLDRSKQESKATYPTSLG